MEDITSKELSLMIDLMVAISEKAREGVLTKLLKKYQQQAEE